METERMTEINEWIVICDFIAEKDGDIREVQLFIKKGDRIQLWRPKK